MPENSRNDYSGLSGSTLDEADRGTPLSRLPGPFRQAAAGFVVHLVASSVGRRDSNEGKDTFYPREPWNVSGSEGDIDKRRGDQPIVTA